LALVSFTWSWLTSFVWAVSVTDNYMVVRELAEDQVDRRLRALADPTRWDIVRRCAFGEALVTGLADTYPMSFAAVQKHLIVLERAGLITKKRRGRKQLVRSDADAIGGVWHVLDEFEATWRGRIKRMSDVLTEHSGPDDRRLGRHGPGGPQRHGDRRLPRPGRAGVAAVDSTAQASSAGGTAVFPRDVLAPQPGPGR